MTPEQESDFAQLIAICQAQKHAITLVLHMLSLGPQRELMEKSLRTARITAQKQLQEHAGDPRLSILAAHHREYIAMLEHALAEPSGSPLGVRPVT